MCPAPFFRIGIVLAALLFLSPARAAAQQPVSVEQFAKTIQAETKQHKLRVVLLVDLANTDGLITEQTQGVTYEISDFLSVKSGKTKFLWARSKWLAGQETLSVEDPQSVQDIDALCAKNKCDALLLGRVQDLPAGTSVSLKIVHPQSKDVLGELSALLPMRTGEPLSWTDPNFIDESPYAKAGKDGVTIPRCRYMPDPSFSKEARALNIQGAVILRAVLSRKGTMEKIVVVRRLGYGLDRNAIEAVRSWKCQPSRDRTGKPIPVEVPVEVTFRIF